jgi:hypothetical protein
MEKNYHYRHTLHVHMNCKNILVYRTLLNVECTVTVIDRSHNKANNGIRDKSDSITIPIHNCCISIVEGTGYPERQNVCPVVRIGSPAPSPASECCCPLPFGSKGGDTLACGGSGRGDPIPPKGQALWYSGTGVL